MENWKKKYTCKYCRAIKKSIKRQKKALLEDVVHFRRSQYLTKMTSPYLLKTTSPIESHFNKVEKGKGQKALDSNVNQCEAHVRVAEDKQLLVDSIL